MSRLVDKDFRHDDWLLSGLPDDDEDIELDDGNDEYFEQKDRDAELIKDI
jgi:hypothetical protein